MKSANAGNRKLLDKVDRVREREGGGSYRRGSSFMLGDWGKGNGLKIWESSKRGGNEGPRVN